MDPDDSKIAYISYYAGGFRVVEYGKNGIREVGASSTREATTSGASKCGATRTGRSTSSPATAISASTCSATTADAH